jgi:hypothetical protein
MQHAPALPVVHSPTAFLPAVSTQGDVLHVLSHPERVMRTTAGTLVTTIVGATGLATWPELVMVLGGGLSSSDAATVHGVLDTLAKIVEDHPEQVGCRSQQNQQRQTTRTHARAAGAQLQTCQRTAPPNSNRGAPATSSAPGTPPRQAHRRWLQQQQQQQQQQQEQHHSRDRCIIPTMPVLMLLFACFPPGLCHCHGPS